MKQTLLCVFSTMIVSSLFLIASADASPFFANGQFTKNGIEWCQENQPLYEVLGEKFFEHHNHSIESRVCVSLYSDYFWTYDGPDRIEKLIERSRHYSQLEIIESYEESETGIIDTTPAENKDQTLIQGTTEDGSLMVQMISSSPRINQSMEINLSFHNFENRLISNVNYGIKIFQDEELILEQNNIFSEKGLSSLTTRPLNSDEPVDITISINGIGPRANPEEWVEPKGEILMFTVVPEFGMMTVILLAVGIMIMVFFSVKNKIQRYPIT